MKKLPIVIFIGLAAIATSCKEATKEVKSDVVVENNMSSGENKERKYFLTTNAVAFEDKKITPKIFDAYQNITEDLVNADFESAKKHTADLLLAVEDGDKSKWNRVQQIANTLSNVEDLDMYRVGYLDLNRELEGILKEEISSGEIYMQYCPMAFNNKGAYWFASDKEIMNPYFGDQMLHCGGVKETFK